jgi:hypothetical protein
MRFVLQLQSKQLKYFLKQHFYYQLNQGFRLVYELSYLKKNILGDNKNVVLKIILVTSIAIAIQTSFY